MKKVRLASIGAIIFNVVAMTILVGVLVMFCLLPNIFPYYGIIGAAVLIAFCIGSFVLRLHFKLIANFEDNSLTVVQFTIQKFSLVSIENVAYFPATNMFGKATIELQLSNGNLVNINVTGFGKRDTTKRAEQLAQLVAAYSEYIKKEAQEEK